MAEAAAAREALENSLNLGGDNASEPEPTAQSSLGHAAAGTMKKEVVETINGKRVTLRGLGFSDFVHIANQALHEWRKIQLEGLAQVLATIDDAAERREFATPRRLEIATATVEDLPKRTAQTVRRDKKGNPVRDESGRLAIMEQEVPYETWWMSHTLQGQLHATWLSARDSNPELTFDDVETWFRVGEAFDEEALRQAADWWRS